MKTETHEQCTVCFEILDATDPTTITADILDQLQLLITKLNIKLLRNSPICDACLAKVKSACKFKTSYLDLQETFHDIKLEEDAYSEKPAVCEICKSIISPSDTIPLFDPVTKINKLMLINHLSPELESKVNEDPQTCESCHKSMLNFCNITNLLSVFDQDNVDIETPSTTVKTEHQDVDCSLVSASSSKDISTRLKKEESPSEDEEAEDKDCTEYEEFLTKNEELDLKMDCDEEQGDERMTTNITQKTEESSDCSTVWNESDGRNTVMETLTNNENTIANLNIAEFKIKLINNFQKNSEEKSVFEEKLDNLNMFQCSMCPYKTKHKRSLKRHIFTHKNPDEVKMFHCAICQHKTRQKGNLKMHLLIHKKPEEIDLFQCSVCEYKTRHKRNLNEHLLTHMKPDEVEMFQCAICQHKTKHKSHLKEHVLTHKKPNEVEMFQCDTCQYKTKYKRSLKMHILTHKKPEEIEMFQCTICPFKTKHKNNLKTHMLRHKKPDEVKMFQCTICQHKTKQKSNIKRHMLIHKKPGELEML